MRGALPAGMHRLLVLSLFLVGMVGCGSDATPPECTGSSCACPAGTACDLGGSACEGESCSLDCTDDNECSGSCGESCSIDCSGGSTCDVTVGPSGSVTCSDGATCNITCTGSCSLSCSGDATCSLACGDAAAETVVEGGSCPGDEG
jgi:hypothetical protein